MTGILTTLNTAKDALLVQQYGISVTGNNIANVNNADYSRQTMELENSASLKISGYLFGTGVQAEQVTQSVDQLLENRLTTEQSALSASEEAENYIRIIEDFFNESSDNSISNSLNTFWNAWNDLSNNPDDDSERLIVIESGQELSERITTAYSYLDEVETEISSKLITAVDQINLLTEEIAELNVEIMGNETRRTANDLRDQRNALLDQLGELIDIEILEDPSGSVTVTSGNGLPMVSGESSYTLGVKDSEVVWVNNAGGFQTISDDITGGQIAGWLDIREEILPKYQAELDELAHELIWALNEQHAQGAGLSYFSEEITGTYAVDNSGWLSRLSYGDRIDYTSDLTLWIEDTTDSETDYTKIEMDMGISEASLTNWAAGADLPADEAVYVFTVMDGTTVGDQVVTQSDGDNLGVAVSGSGTVATVMQDNTQAPIAEQVLVIGGGDYSTTEIEIAYAGGDAKPSAASIADALNEVEGVSAYASESRMTLDVSDLSPLGLSNETVTFGIYVDGVTHYETFTLDSTLGGYEEQFEDAFLSAAEALNEVYGDDDLSLEYDATSAATSAFTLVSSSGRTIGIEGVEIQDSSGTPLTADHYIEVSGNGAEPVQQVGRGSAATIVDSAVVTGTLTIEAAPEISITSSVEGTSGGLFENRRAEFGSAILTLGGEGGYGGFDAGDTVTFTIDGTYDATITIPAAAATEQEMADALYVGLTSTTPPLDSEGYRIVQNGLSISIIKAEDLEDPIEITNFMEITGSGDATLAARTGTGSETAEPENDLLVSGSDPLKNSVTSSLFDDEGIIRWEVFDTNGISTGKTGLITVADAENISVTDEEGQALLTFDISAGSLVAGNTLSITVDEVTDEAGNDEGAVDPLDFTIRGDANSQNATYTFNVLTGGTVGSLPEEDDPFITIEWSNGTSSGTIVLEEPDPPLTPEIPLEIEVDGMTLCFESGTLFKGDVFTITTDSDGNPVSTNADGEATGELMSDWHWTLETFADQFNKDAAGLSASVNSENQLVIAASESYHVMENITYSQENGFTEDNVTMEITDWSALNFEATELELSRNSDGEWLVINDPTGGNAVLIPEGGDDDGFGIDFSGDGLADMTIQFTQSVTGEGSLSFDLMKHDADDIGFAFSDESGMMAAAGINTFFTGEDATNMAVNEVIQDTGFLAAATIDSDSGEIASGDNSNALALAEVQYQSLEMKQWDFSRGEAASTDITTVTLDGYYSTMLGALGVDSSNIRSATEFAELMVNYITEERDAVSAVSLDEEMVKLIEYQQAFNAASKLVTVADEMLDTIISMR